MKVKFAKPTFPGQDHVIVQVEHGAENDQLYTKHVKVGEIITLDDDLGYKVLSQYRGLFEMVQEDKSVKELSKK
jgi:hypothetical protein